VRLRVEWRERDGNVGEGTDVRGRRAEKVLEGREERGDGGLERSGKGGADGR